MRDSTMTIFLYLVIYPLWINGEINLTKTSIHRTFFAHVVVYPYPNDGYWIRTNVAWLRTKHPKPLDESAIIFIYIL